MLTGRADFQMNCLSLARPSRVLRPSVFAQCLRLLASTPADGKDAKKAAAGERRTSDKAQIRERLSTVKHKLLVMSGKGGVGKSTFSTTLARALAEISSKSKVALLDIDMCGPSQPRLTGTEDMRVEAGRGGWTPVQLATNLSVMSIGFLMADKTEPVILRGPRKDGVIKQFLTDVDWGVVDFMIVDTPPGTSDEHMSIVEHLLSGGPIQGAILLSTPQELSLLDVRKQANFCARQSLPVFGVVENMSGFVCPSCGVESAIFAPTTGGVKAMCEQMDLRYLGRVPLDPALADCADRGADFLAAKSDSPAARAFRDIAMIVHHICERR